MRLISSVPGTTERKERGRIKKYSYPAFVAGSNDELKSANAPSVRKNEKYEVPENVVGNVNFIFPNIQTFSHENLPKYSVCLIISWVSISAEFSLVLNSTSFLLYSLSIFILVWRYSL
jgi:hypothetical protein